MADVKITGLPAGTTINDDDLVEIVDDVAGTPTSKKMTRSNFLGEIGTFTPTITFGGASVGVAYDATKTEGRYTLVSDEVSITLRLTLTSKGSSTGTVNIASLPFTSNNTHSNISPCSIYFADISFANQMSSQVPRNTSTVLLVETLEAGTTSVMDDTNFSDTSDINISVKYKIA